jgi:hypothetical protein
MSFSFVSFLASFLAGFFGSLLVRANISRIKKAYFWFRFPIEHGGYFEWFFACSLSVACAFFLEWLLPSGLFRFLLVFPVLLFSLLLCVYQMFFQFGFLWSLFVFAFCSSLGYFLFLFIEALK